MVDQEIIITKKIKINKKQIIGFFVIMILCLFVQTNIISIKDSILIITIPLSIRYLICKFILKKLI